MKMFQNINLTVLFLSLSLTSISQITDTLTLIWSDEFNGNELDNTKWASCPEWHRQGGSYWSKEKSKLRN